MTLLIQGDSANLLCLIGWCLCLWTQPFTWDWSYLAPALTPVVGWDDSWTARKSVCFPFKCSDSELLIVSDCSSCLYFLKKQTPVPLRSFFLLGSGIRSFNFLFIIKWACTYPDWRNYGLIQPACQRVNGVHEALCQWWWCSVDTRAASPEHCWRDPAEHRAQEMGEISQYRGQTHAGFIIYSTDKHGSHVSAITELKSEQMCSFWAWLMTAHETGKNEILTL